MKIYMIIGEQSGDVYGANLAKELLKLVKKKTKKKIVFQKPISPLGQKLLESIKDCF